MLCVVGVLQGVLEVGLLLEIHLQVEVQGV